MSRVDGEGPSRIGGGGCEAVQSMVRLAALKMVALEYSSAR